MMALLLSLALCSAARAGEAGAGGVDAFNTALAGGDLAAADTALGGLIDGGAHTADVYYNLGNLRYRQERYPEAVLAWRCAERLAPRDPDVQANLEVARGKLTGVPSGRVQASAPVWAPWQAALTPDEGEWIGGAVLGAALAALALGGASGARRGPGWLRPAGIGGAVVGLLLAGGGLAAGAGARVGVLLHPAKLTSDLGGGSVLSSLPAGAEVRIEDEGGGELRVALGDGAQGWVGAANVGVADPESGCRATP